MSDYSKTLLTHTAVALGGGLFVFLTAAESITTNAWAQAGCGAGLAVLIGLGITGAWRGNQPPS